MDLGGSPRISYVGFQFAFAFFLCVIQGTKPGFDMVVARDRVIGILLGNFVVYLLFTNVWPVSVAARLMPAVRALMGKMRDMLGGGKMAALYGAEAYAQIGALERDLDLSAYEPEILHPGPEWLERRQRVAAELAALPGALLLAAGHDPALSRDVSARLASLGGGPPALVDETAAGPLPALRGWIEPRLTVWTT